MAVPKKKTSKSKRNSRRSHDGLKKVFISYDKVTGEPKLSHHISLKDGNYNGKKILKDNAKEVTELKKTKNQDKSNANIKEIEVKK